MIETGSIVMSAQSVSQLVIIIQPRTTCWGVLSIILAALLTRALMMMLLMMMMYNKNLLRCVVNHVGSNVSQRIDDGSRNVAEGKSLNGWRRRVIEVMMMIVRMHYSKRPPDLYSCLLESPPLWLYTAWLASTVVSLKSRMMSSYTWRKIWSPV